MMMNRRRSSRIRVMIIGVMMTIKTIITIMATFCLTVLQIT